MKEINIFANKLGEIATADIGDSQGGKGIMRSDLLPLQDYMKFSGVAVTVQCAPGDNLAINKAMAIAKPGSVLVITCEEKSDCALLGDLFATECMARGIRAAVIDGYCRDKRSIIEIGFPVFCKGTNLRKPNMERNGTVNKPVCCGGIHVEMGDIVVGDADGIVIVKPEDAEETLEKAVQHQKKMDGLRIKCEQGATTVEVLNLFEKLGMTHEDIVKSGNPF